MNFDKPPLDELKEDEKERVYAFSFVEADKRKLEETKVCLICAINMN